MMVIETTDIESMDGIARRLRGTGGGQQAEAVVKAVKLINSANGMLDASNRSVALYHLAVALAGESRAPAALESASFMVNGNF